MENSNQKEISRKAIEMWASDGTDQAEHIFSDNYVNHQQPDVKGGVSSIDLAEWTELVKTNHESFPDLSVTILTQIQEGDLVATRWSFTATHTGQFLEHAPTGKRATWTGVQIDRHQDGKIIESWVDWDKYRFYEELGLLK